MSGYISCGLRHADEILQSELLAVETDYFRTPSRGRKVCSSDSEYSDSDSDGNSDELSESFVNDDDENPTNDASDTFNEGTSDDVVTAEPDEIEEDQKINSFLALKCGCHFGSHRQSCSELFEKTDVIDIRCQCSELTSEQLDMLILGSLDGHMKEGKKRSKNAYYIKDHQVCKKTFMFLRCIGKKRLNNLRTHLKNNGIVPRIHKNTKRSPHNTTSFENITAITTFLKNYAEREGLSLPGRVPGYNNFDLKLLPSSTSKAALWREYKQAATLNGLMYVKYTKFVITWNSLLPYIRILQPSTDLCHTCQKGREKIGLSGNITDEEKLDILNEYQDHVNKSRAERAHYNSVVDDSKEFLNLHRNISLLSPNETCSLVGTVHYSFDYAQQVQFPANPQQPGPIYFKTPRKCGVFGVCCESIPRQINYLIDESVATGKGANATISYLHDFLKFHGAGETSVHLHADNCGGQNKNNYVLWYLAWRTINKLHLEIAYSFLVAGHTKFSPDWCFGIMKKKIRRTFISSLFDIIEATDTSSVTGVNVGKLVGLHDGSVLVKTYLWDGHFSTYFRKLKGISKFHHYRFSSDSPGKVFYREFVDSPEKEFQLLKDDKLPPNESLPPQVIPSGLTKERKEYLYKEIREFCRRGTEDLVAPICN